jgi:hypothetical protein
MPEEVSDDFVVELTGVSAEDAYALGFEGGAFSAYCDAKAIGHHVVFTANVGMLEMICVERGWTLAVIESGAKHLLIEIEKGNA